MKPIPLFSISLIILLSGYFRTSYADLTNNDSMPLTHGSWSYKGNNCDILNQIELECFVVFFSKKISMIGTENTSVAMDLASHRLTLTH